MRSLPCGSTCCVVANVGSLYLRQNSVKLERRAIGHLLPGRFVSPDWRDSEADLLFSVEREPHTAPVLLYVLLESATRLMPIAAIDLPAPHDASASDA